MKTEAEIQAMLDNIIIQEEESKAKGNVTAQKRLFNRGIALAWVLEKEGALATLIFDKETLNFLSCLY